MRVADVMQDTSEFCTFAVVAGGEFEYFRLSKMVLEVMIFKDLN